MGWRTRFRRPSRVPRNCTLLSSALLTLAFAVSFTTQTSISCLTGSGLTMTGCTAFGYGNDVTIRNWARTYLENAQHQSNSFCNKVWEEADDWLQSFMTGIFTSATLNGESKSAIGTYGGSNWQSGWLGSWMRDEGVPALVRGNTLFNTSLHEAGHKVCDEGDFGVDCDPDDEDSVNQAVDDCFIQH